MLTTLWKIYQYSCIKHIKQNLGLKDLKYAGLHQFKDDCAQIQKPIVPYFTLSEKWDKEQLMIQLKYFMIGPPGGSFMFKMNPLLIY